MQPKDVVILVLAICAGIFLIALLALALKLRSIKKQAESGEERAAKVKIVGGVRYSEDDAIAGQEFQTPRRGTRKKFRARRRSGFGRRRGSLRGFRDGHSALTPSFDGLRNARISFA